MIDTCRRSVADQLIVPPVCDRIHRLLTVHSHVWMWMWIHCEQGSSSYGCCVFLSQVTLLHGVGVSTPSGIPGKPKLCSSTVTHAGTVSQFHSRFIPHWFTMKISFIQLYSISRHVCFCVFFPSHAERQKLSLSCRNHCIFQVASSPLSQIKCITAKQMP